MPVTAIKPARIYGVRFYAKILVPVLLLFILPASGCDRASADHLFPFIEKFTVIVPIDAVFQKSDGTDHKGSLKAGTEIETTETDYISKVYFVTASGEKGYFAVDSNLLTGTGGMQTYYDDCLKSDGYIGYNLVP